jgi:hypothetical protein
MTEEELKNWFLNMFYSCYLVKDDDYPDNIFYYYDKLYLRKCVLLNILGRELEPPNKIKGEWLFELCLGNLLLCDYNNIWMFLEEHYSANYTLKFFISKFISYICCYKYVNFNLKRNRYDILWNFLHNNYSNYLYF